MISGQNKIQSTESAISADNLLQSTLIVDGFEVKMQMNELKRQQLGVNKRPKQNVHFVLSLAPVVEEEQKRTRFLPSVRI